MARVLHSLWTLAIDRVRRLFVTEMHTCPRRAESGLDRDDNPFRGSGTNLDSFAVRHGRSEPGINAGERSCTFCGSLHPDDFMRYVEEGQQLGATTKSYKVYLRLVFPEPPVVNCKFYWRHLSDDQMRAFVELWNAGRVNVDYPGAFHTFFMRPLSEIPRADNGVGDVPPAT